MAILCIDLKSFYASVECVLRGLDPFKTNLVVADKSRGDGSVVLAITPHLKAKGVKSRCRVFELPKDIDIIYAKPRMKKYIEYSSMVYSIYLDYVSNDDIYIYSIDEAFLDISPYLKYYNKSSFELAAEITNSIYTKLGIKANCGIGDNLFLSKVALDVLAKHTQEGIAYLNKELFDQHILDISPLTKIWGIGSQTEKRLHQMGIYTLRDLKNTDIQRLENEFGVIGNELYEHAHGIDRNTIKDIKNYHPKNTSIGYGQVLFRDYTYQQLDVILLETVDEIATELITRKLSCQLISLGITYSKEVGGGFSRERTLSHPTNSRQILLDEFRSLYYQHIEDLPIRKIEVRVGKLASAEYIQFSLFDDNEQLIKERKLYEAIGDIKERYGKNSVNLAISHTEDGTKIKRNKLIGGHNAE